MVQDTLRKNRRGLMLDAACEIAITQGAAQLTLDAVAKSAGVSKGGLLYHFPNKEALILGMIEQANLAFQESVEAVYATLPDKQGRWLHAYVEASFADEGTSPNLVAGLMTASANNPDLLESLDQELEKWIAQATADGTSLQVAQLVIAATNGVWFERLLGSRRSQADLKQTLLDMIDDETT